MLVLLNVENVIDINAPSVEEKLNYFSFTVMQKCIENSVLKMLE